MLSLLSQLKQIKDLIDMISSYSFRIGSFALFVNVSNNERSICLIIIGLETKT
jgi:hypothetical protein